MAVKLSLSREKRGLGHEEARSLILRAVLIGVVELVKAVGRVFALRLFQAERKTLDLTIAPAERDARFGEVELQFSKFVCCHTLHLVCG